MAAGALDVVVRFVGDSSKLRDETAKIEGTGGKLKTWAKGVGAAVAGAFAVDQIRDFVNMGAELQDQLAASQTIFGKGAKTIEQWSKTTTESLGISQTSALDAANTFAAFGKGAGLTGRDLASFSTDLTGLAGDLASFRGTSTEEAITAVGAALRGESEPIRAYGVMLDAATLKARAMSMGLVESTADINKVKSAQMTAAGAFRTYGKAIEKHGKDSTEAQVALQKFELAQSKVAAATEGTVPELTQQQKVLAAQAEIFAQTGDAQGDFAKTSGSAANQQKVLTAQMDDAKTAIGSALLPVVQKLIPYLSKMATFLEDNTSWLIPLAGYILAVAAAFKVWTIIQALFNIQVGISAGWILLIIAALVALGVGIFLLVKNWEKVTAAFKVTWEWIKGVWQSALEWLKKPIDAAWRFIQTTWDKVLGAFKAAWNWLKVNWPLVLAILTGPIGLAVFAITKNWDRIRAAAASVFNWIRATWSTLAGILTAPFVWAAGVITGAWDAVLRFFRELPGKIGGFFAGLAETLSAPFRAAFRAIASLWNNTVGALRFEVPSFIPGIGGKGWDVPDIPTLAKGGSVLSTGLAVVHEGEQFSGVGNTFPTDSTVVYNINVEVGATSNPYQVGRAVVDAIRSYESIAGRSWRATS